MEHTREERAARLAEAGVHTFRIAELAAAIRGESAYLEHGRNGTTLVKTGSIRVVLEALREGAALSEHRAPGNATVQVIEGEVRYCTGDSVTYLGAGELLAMPQGLPHAVEAVRDSLFLLTFAAAP